MNGRCLRAGCGTFAPMRSPWVHALSLMVILTACQGPSADPCNHFYEPYPDVISDRHRTDRNAELLDAMAQYRQGRYAEAITLLEGLITKGVEPYHLRLYMASAQLGAGRPFDAELQLDLVERDPRKRYGEVVEWYRVLCWICSGQEDRALAQAKRIAGKPRHLYKRQAADLAKALGS